jgi:hypothetical protein
MEMIDDARHPIKRQDNAVVSPRGASRGLGGMEDVADRRSLSSFVLHGINGRTTMSHSWPLFNAINQPGEDKSMK